MVSKYILIESLLKHYKIKLETFIELHSKTKYLFRRRDIHLGFPYLTD